MLLRVLACSAVLCTVAGSTLAQGPLTSEVSYQGRLTDGGLTPTGLYDLQFRLFDDPAGGSQVGNTAFEDNVQVTGGLFTASPDFGSAAFGQSKQLWVQVEVRPGASAGAFTAMLPRQRMLSAPVASGLRVPFAMNVASAQTPFTLNNAANGRTMEVTNTDASSLYHVLKTESSGVTYAQGAYNLASGGALYAFSAGFQPTFRVDNSATIGDAGIAVGLWGDTIGLQIEGLATDATKPGIEVLLPSTADSLIGGKFSLTGNAGTGATALRGEILGATASYDSVAVEAINTRGYGVHAHSVSNAGVYSETDSGSYSLMAINRSGLYGVGGIIEGASGSAGVLGWNRAATSSGPGVYALASSSTAPALRAERTATIGSTPTIYALNPSGSAFAFGVHSAMTATSGGGSSTALRGESRSTTGSGIGVWGSHDGTGFGVYGTAAPGGYGVRGSANSDGNGNGWAGYFTGQVYVSSELGIGVLNPVFPIQHSSGARLTGAGVWSNASDRNLKDNITPVDPSDVLARVVSMPVAAWNYKVEGKDVQHIGPMAQDFKSAFGLGDSDKVIATVDADGVALAAIQGLNKKLEAKDAELAALRARLAALEEKLARMIDRQTEK